MIVFTSIVLIVILELYIKDDDNQSTLNNIKLNCKYFGVKK